MVRAVDERPSTLRDYLDVLWRRKWIVLQALVLVPVAAVLWSLREPPLYRASAAVLVNMQNLPANLQNVPDPLQFDSTRNMRTQAELARVPEVARRTVEAAGLENWGPWDLLGASSVTMGDENDILTFSVVNGDGALATRLATEYARQFTLYRHELDTRALAEVRRAAEDRIEELEAAGDTGSPLYRSLLEQREQVATMEALQTSRAVLVRPATGAGKIQPQPRRNGVLGIALGLFLGLGLAVLLEALDPRIRSANKIAQALRLPLLARIPRPPRRIRKRTMPVVVADPSAPEAEAFHILRTNIELANLEHRARAIMVTSATDEDGKSTTAANLAVAFARAGRRVMLVDLDLRGGILHRFFKLNRAPGLTDIARGTAPVDAIVEFDVGLSALPAASSNGRAGGRLEILPSGPLPSNAGEFIARLPLDRILEELRGRSDLILIDSPPLLRVGDAATLSAAVDALLVVARLNAVRPPMLEELNRILGMCRAAKLGVVVTGAEAETEYKYLTSPYLRPHRPSDTPQGELTTERLEARPPFASRDQADS
jgi:capsular exopolysaccharide synthesis family protein